MASLHYQNIFSVVSGNKPTLDALLRGELAVNLVDGKLFFRKVVDSANEATDVIAEASLNPASLPDLTDVELASLAEGQALVYSAADGKWKNVALTSASLGDFDTAVNALIDAAVTNGTVQAHSDVLDEVAKLDAEGLVYRKADGTFAEMTASGENGVKVAVDADAATVKVGLGAVGTAGTYTKVTTDAQGRVTAGENPTTLAGYGITDGVNKGGDQLTGKLSYVGVDIATLTENDLVTKAYADSVALGFVPHEPVRTAAIVAIDGAYVAGTTESGYPGVGATFTTSVKTIAGVTLATGDRVLLVAQTDATQNGIYAVTSVTDKVVLTRAEDFDGHPTITYDGLTVLVAANDAEQRGVVYGLKNRGNIVFGTDAIEFIEVFAPSSYQAGAGIQIVDGTIAVIEGTTVKVIGGKLEVASGSGNAGKVLTAGEDGTAATWQAVDFSNFATLDGTNNTFSVTPKSSAAQDAATADGDELAKVSTVKAYASEAVENLTYTDETETGATEQVGGIAKGEKLSNITFPEFANKLLHRYVAPTGVGLTLTPTNGGVYEMGTTQSVTGGTVRWTNGSQKVTKAEILTGGTAVGEVTLDASASSATVTLTAADSITANKMFTARITDATSTYTGGNVSFTFVYPFYRGVLASGAAVDGASVAGLTKAVQTKGNKTYKFTTSGVEQVVFAYPASYGNLTSIMDQNNFENLNAFTKSTVSVTGLDGTAQNYNVYVCSTNINDFGYTFKF